MKTILLWKVVAISLAYVVCMYLLDCPKEGEGEGERDSDFEINWICHLPHVLYAVPVTAAAAHLAFATARMSLEKDWVVTIANGDKEWLSFINSKMTLIDLTW
jgi:hypothetical protein